jgi:hypothetical protein
MSVLQSFGEDIWIAAGGEVTSAGLAYPTRMALIRLEDGGLFVWSPVALTPDLRAETDALGAVRFIVTPTAMHHLALLDWRAAYPNAALYAAPESRKRSPHIAFDAVLGDATEAGWAGQIDQVAMHGNAIATEIVFFHRKSGTVLFADLLQNFAPEWFSGWRALMAALDDMIGATPRTPRKFRLAFTNRKAARASLARICAWPARQVLMAHGTPVREEGAAFLADAFAWLKPRL